jgi:hypothetical protein
MLQRSDEWYAARCGKATASNFRKILATIKSGEAADRRNYRAQLVCERLTGKVDQGFTNDAMRWGIENEPFALAAYIAQTGVYVDEEGFIPHHTLLAGASPDGLIGLDGGIEIKCPTKAVHIETLRAQRMPAEHIPQVQGCMWISGREWWDFVSYHPEFPHGLQLFVTRVLRDDAYISTLEKSVEAFLNEVATEVEELTAIAA